MMRRSVPFSSMWVAKLWRSVMNRNQLAETAQVRRFAARRLQGLGIHVAALAKAGEQPLLPRGVLATSERVHRAPPGAQHCQQARRQHGITILFALAKAGEQPLLPRGVPSRNRRV